MNACVYPDKKLSTQRLLAGSTKDTMAGGWFAHEVNSSGKTKVSKILDLVEKTTENVNIVNEITAEKANLLYWASQVVAGFNYALVYQTTENPINFKCVLIFQQLPAAGGKYVVSKAFDASASRPGACKECSATHPNAKAFCEGEVAVLKQDTGNETTKGAYLFASLSGTLLMWLLL